MADHSKRKSTEKQAEFYFGHKVKDNRFGDSNLSTPFIWKKKWAKEHPKLKGKKLKEMVAKNLEKRKRSLKTEVADVKTLREQRIREKVALEQMRDDLKLQIERENYGILNHQEEAFHKKQISERALIRIKNCREKRFDKVFKIALFALETAESVSKELELDKLAAKVSSRRYFKKITAKIKIIFELKNPFSTIYQIDNKESLEKLNSEISKILELRENSLFWQTVQKLAEFRLSDINCHSDCVTKEITRTLDGKNFDALDDLEAKVVKMVGDAHTGKDVIDFEYWQSLLSFISLYKAKSLLSDFYAASIVTKLKLEKQFPELFRKPKPIPRKNTKIDLVHRDRELQKVQKDIQKLVLRKTGHSPEEQKIGKSMLTQNQFDAFLRESREKVIKKGKSDQPKFEKSNVSSDRTTSQKLFDREAQKPLEEGEEQMSSKSVDVRGSYWWQDKFRPRKPLYFNRIKTGYDWNQYNRSHYDSENPPPKIVMGYRFNIFYPDLIDIKNAPTYVVERFPDDEDFVVLKFKAGAPYEDVAFKIVSKEWNKDTRGGFKSIFSNGVLQLFFSFKRFSYRR